MLDDNPDDLAQIRRLLRDTTEFTADYLSDARQAIAKIQSGCYDIIVLDIHMPGLSGLDLISQLRALEHFQWLPVVFLTGSTSPEELSESLLRGGDAVLSKPVQASLLLQQLQAFRRTIKRQRAMEADNASLKRQTQIDPLTGLLNRRGLDEQTQHALDECAFNGDDISVLMIDIDHFKGYNDRHGHPEGDHAIQTVAAAIRLGAERATDLVCRYGGEEFCVVLPHTAADGAMAVAHHIRDNLAALALMTDTNPKGRVTISLGIASGRAHGHESSASIAHRLTDEADRALYQAKRAGRDRIHCNQIAAASPQLQTKLS